MTLCSGVWPKATHEEVAFEGKNCPVCEAMREVKWSAEEAKEEKERLEGDIARLTAELEQWRHDSLVPTLEELRKRNGV
jgi:hypothetical protein